MYETRRYLIDSSHFLAVLDPIGFEESPNSIESADHTQNCNSQPAKITHVVVGNEDDVPQMERSNARQESLLVVHQSSKHILYSSENFM